jgi:hypothetical protein
MMKRWMIGVCSGMFVFAIVLALVPGCASSSSTGGGSVDGGHDGASGGGSGGGGW